MTRWRPTRAGILNVWRFHDETFTFHDGRLLIRGPNGSGKSKALELLVPHLLAAKMPEAMHWNLVGDTTEGIRAGFVWLEFERDGEFLTCGARLQASTSTTEVQVSYFTTTLRIGDLVLVNEAARPITRVNLARAIGPNGEVHGDPHDYKAVLRATLFDGMSEDRYESLLRLLTSAELDLTKPPLELAKTGRERLERQQEKRDRIDDAIAVVTTLLERRNDHARLVAREAAAELRTATEKLAGLSQDTDPEYDVTRQALSEATRDEQRLTQEAAEIDARLHSAPTSERARARAEEAAQLAAALKARADADDELARTAAQQAERAAEAARKAKVENEVPGDETRIRAQRNAVVRYDNAVMARDAARALLDAERAELEQAEAAEARAAEELQAAQAKQDEDLAAWAAGCRELIVVDITEIDDAVAGARAELSRQEQQLEETRTAQRNQLPQYTALREKLANQVDVPPPAPYTRDTERATAKGAPLWRLVEFRPHMPLGLCASIEAALEASGLLDAWVTPDSPNLLDHDTFAEEVLATPAPGASLLDMLVAEAPAVQRLLGGIAFGESAPDHPAAVGADGTWRLGSLRGRWTKPEPTYIGADARELAAQRRVGELTTLIDQLKADLDELQETEQRIAARKEALANDLATRPGRHDLDMTAHIRAQARTAALRATVARAQQVSDDAEAQVAQAIPDNDLPSTEQELDELLDAISAFRQAEAAWLDRKREAEQAERTATEARARAATSREHAVEAERTAILQAQELGVATDEAELTRLRARRTEITTELADLRERRSTLERAVGTLAEKHAARVAEREAVIAARDAAEKRVRDLHDDGLEARSKTVADAELLLTHAVQDARLILGNRIGLTLEPDLVVTLDRRPVTPAELIDWLHEQRDVVNDHIATAERELFDRTFTDTVRETMADRVRADEELAATVNPRLEGFGMRLRPEVAPDAEALLFQDPSAPWHRLVLEIDRGKAWQPLTKRAQKALSRGEQAMFRYVPLIAVIAAHYPATAPRLVVLDDALSGMDSANRSGLLELLVSCDLDLVLTSDSDWGDYRELPGIAIHQLVTSDDAVTSVRFTWTGRG
ncbi:hypothetical protein Lesp02_41150 [Lentzea sp. NBRC 105346]|uniref:SbcC/MukB-like Walker B domain-containing protein n=1 Tax=Lentzea sp. NBRC 105346 TaxID=3032205 RepID=UPI0024A0D957|nr:SbcC/MukB-like Walker B domain-containing protein [Lentzea sp. NBRC 105346]GLZ31927.1 hypothetical protein Lesp02_41150 [Lentzea sp. NBRC 105346]